MISVCTHFRVRKAYHTCELSVVSRIDQFQQSYFHIPGTCYQMLLLLYGLCMIPGTWDKKKEKRGNRFHTSYEYNVKEGKKKGNGQKRELPVDYWPETGGQKYEGSKHSIWAHVIGQHHLPPVSAVHRPGPPDSRYFGQLPPVFGHFL